MGEDTDFEDKFFCLTGLYIAVQAAQVSPDGP